MNASDAVRVTDLHYCEAPEEMSRSGCLGFVRFTLNGLVVIDGVALRAQKSGDLILAWPSRRDARGRSHPIALPLPAVRDEVNRAILDEVRVVLQRSEVHGVKAREAKS